MIRIVFIDDEVNVLKGMQRTLHGMRKEWSMEFFSSATAALDALAKSPADVVVSDMQMQGMDGWELLETVKKLSPQAARFMLSGHSHPASIMRSVGIVHQVLAKPCDSATLKDAITRTQWVKLLLSDETLAGIVGRVDMLPGAPAVFQRLLLCLRRPDSTAADVARIIEGDVAMAANIMKLVNSAFFGSRNPVNSIERAVAYLGFDTIGSLVLGHDVFQNRRSGGATSFGHEQLWNHSLRVAGAARAIGVCEGLPATTVEELFLSGFFHDVGEIVLSAANPDDSADQRAIHAKVGGYLLGLWGLPMPIVEAVAFHDAPARASGDGLSHAGIIHVANHLVTAADQSAAEDAQPLDRGYVESRHLEPRLAAWRNIVQEQLRSGQSSSAALESKIA